MLKKPEVCILPVAGMSTRNLPATKVIHKGFLTLHGKPIIQYAVDACRAAGIKEIVFVYSDEAGKDLFSRYFSPNEALERHLKEQGKDELLKAVRDIVPEGMTFAFARQAEPKGNGHAILMAKELVGKRDFVVMWPDDVYINFHGEGVLQQLTDVYLETGGMVENIIEFTREEMVRYGALAGAVRAGRIVKAKGLVEKPALADVPSNYASMGPYILPNIIMDILPEVQRGTNGEINLTDAMELAAQRGVSLHGVLCDAVRFDCGTTRELEKSNMKLSIMQDPELRAWAREIVDHMVV